MTGPLRTVLAVLLATALLGATAPAIDGARESRAAARLAAETRELCRAAERLAAGSDRVAAGADGARRVVRVGVPDDGRLRLRTVPPGSTATDTGPALAWRVDGGPWHGRRLGERPGAHAPAVGLAPAGGDLLLGPGSHRLRLSLRARHDGAVVRVVPARGGEG